MHPSLKKYEFENRQELARFLEAVTHAVIAYEDSGDKDFPVRLVHFVGFQSKPTAESIQALTKELNETAEFENTFGKVGKSVTVAEAPSYVLDTIKEMILHGQDLGNYAFKKFKNSLLEDDVSVAVNRLLEG